MITLLSFLTEISDYHLLIKIIYTPLTRFCQYFLIVRINYLKFMNAINYYISYIYDINYRLEYKANNRKYPKLFQPTDNLDNFGYKY
jgi:hypothetical protein